MSPSRMARPSCATCTLRATSRPPLPITIPTARAKLLLHRAEIDELARHTNQAGQTAVPLRLYLEKGWAKVEIGLVRGRRDYDKREKIRARDDAREIARRMR